tara:strand:- start:227 stop:472 length:246 start_codon:yes stop_codon:yes gene_type:complete
MANLIKKGSGEQQEKAIKVELPDGTGGEIPIQPDAPTIDLMDASSMPSNTYKNGGKIKKTSKAKKVSTAHGAIDKLIKQSK